MQYFQDALTVTVTSTGLFDAYDLVGYNGAKIAAADAVVLGVAKSPVTVIGDPAPVMVLGVVRVKAVGAIAQGARVVSAAAGGVQTVGAGVNSFATALTAAADGEFVDILIR
ncbi:MAG: capsid cement protein [Pseudomonadota bacterium]